MGSTRRFPSPSTTKDPYPLRVAVALSDQTTDKKVNQVTPALFTKAPTPEKMAGLTPEEILDLIGEIGPAPTSGTTWPNRFPMRVQRCYPTGTSSKSRSGVGHETTSVEQTERDLGGGFPPKTGNRRPTRSARVSPVG